MRSSDTMTVRSIFEKSVSAHSRKVALRYKGSAITYQTLEERVNKFANALLNRGIKPGDIIAILLPKCQDYIVAYLAAAKVRAIALGLNANLLSGELSRIVNMVKASAIVTSPGYLLQAYRISKDCSSLRMRISMDGDIDGFCRYEEFAQGAASTPPPIEPKARDIVSIQFTSGTTSRSKGVLLTNSAACWQARSFSETLGIRCGDAYLSLLPIFFSTHHTVLFPFYNANTLILIEKASPRSILAAIEGHGVTYTLGVATIYKILMRYSNFADYALGKLRLALCAGMPLENGMAREFKDKFGRWPVNVLGSTESGLPVINLSRNSETVTAIGKPAKFYNARVLNDAGRGVGMGEVGELALNSPCLMRGYFQRSGEDRSAFKNGWFYTGDLVSVDKCGYFNYISRKTDMINVSGYKVYPPEVERVLSSHPGIKECAVVSAPDALRGQVPKAFVVLNDGSLSNEEIIAFCRMRLPGYMVPRQIVSCNYLPQTPSGKILKRELVAK